MRLVQSLRQLIALKAADAILLRDDLRPVAGLEKRLQAEHVVDMAVGIDDRMQGLIAPGPHGRM